MIDRDSEGPKLKVLPLEGGHLGAGAGVGVVGPGRGTAPKQGPQAAHPSVVWGDGLTP